MRAPQNRRSPRVHGVRRGESCGVPSGCDMGGPLSVERARSSRAWSRSQRSAGRATVRGRRIGGGSSSRCSTRPLHAGRRSGGDLVRKLSSIRRGVKRPDTGASPTSPHQEDVASRRSRQGRCTPQTSGRPHWSLGATTTETASGAERGSRHVEPVAVSEHQDAFAKQRTKLVLNDSQQVWACALESEHPGYLYDCAPWLDANVSHYDLP